MKIFGLDIRLARKDATALDINTVIARLEAAYETFSGVSVNPENCMASPTVNAIVTAVSRRIATLPIKVLRKTEVAGSEGRTKKEDLPNHPVAKLLQTPNGWQDSMAFWLDATSRLVRHGNFYAFKSRGSTGPIRQLIPLGAGAVEVKQADDWSVTYEAVLQGGGRRVFGQDEILHARGPARDGVKGDSPIVDIREAIGLEITAERMGASVFGNSAMPSMVFKHGATSAGFATDEEERKFIEEFQAVYAKRGRFKSMILPFGMEVDTVAIDNDKAQFLATRQYQRTVIAGAFGMPLHLVGDLSRGTFNNVEQQSLDFVGHVVLPYVRIFEAAMERSLLTQEDRNSGVIIRFNIDAALRGDFKSRQEGLNIQRTAGVISANDWREAENMNPISPGDGGDDYWRKGPSGQTADPGGGSPSAQDQQPNDNPQGGQGDQQNAANP